MQPITEALAQAYAAKRDDDLRALYVGGTLTDVAYGVLENEFQARGIAVPKRPDAQQLEQEGAEGTCTRHISWSQEGTRAVGKCLLVGGCVRLCIMYGSVILIKLFLPVLMPLAWVAFVVFLGFAWVSIWRCWRNTRWPAWGYVARAMVVLDAVVVVAMAVRLISEAMQPHSLIQ